MDETFMSYVPLMYVTLKFRQREIYLLGVRRVLSTRVWGSCCTAQAWRGEIEETLRFHQVQSFHQLPPRLKLGNKLASSEIDCGGHKRCVLSDCHHLSRLRNLKARPGEYSSSRSAMPLQMTPPLSTSIVPAPTAWKRIGMLASNSRWSSQTLAIPPFIPSGVFHSQIWMLSLNLYRPSSDE